MSGVTPSQTIGPFFHRALLHEGSREICEQTSPRAERLASASRSKGA